MPIVEAIRNDFARLRDGEDHIYLDNCATTYKPDCVIAAIDNYYRNYSVNSGRSAYKKALEVDEIVSATRNEVAGFIGAHSPEEIVFTRGTSDGLNLIASGYGKKALHKGDVVLTTMAEHASNLLPWMHVCHETGAELRYCVLDEFGRIDLNKFKNALDSHVKIVTLAQITNVLGYEAPIQLMTAAAHAVGALVIVDGAQSVGHIPVNVAKLDCDFLAFSAHKMCGPTGVGVLYGKKNLLNHLEPQQYGGGSNISYTPEGEIHLVNAPYRFETGTLPIAEIFGLQASLHYLSNLSIDAINRRVKDLHRYAVKKLSHCENIRLYNPGAEAGILTFNVNGVFADDAARYLDYLNIYVRSGQHCSRLLEPWLKSRATVRASIYFYNTEDEIDTFSHICEEMNGPAVYEKIFSQRTIAS